MELSNPKFTFDKNNNTPIIYQTMCMCAIHAVWHMLLSLLSVCCPFLCPLSFIFTLVLKVSKYTLSTQ